MQNTNYIYNFISYITVLVVITVAYLLTNYFNLLVSFWSMGSYLRTLHNSSRFCGDDKTGFQEFVDIYSITQNIIRKIFAWKVKTKRQGY